jgi:hypothetical protein
VHDILPPDETWQTTDGPCLVLGPPGLRPMNAGGGWGPADHYSVDEITRRTREARSKQQQSERSHNEQQAGLEAKLEAERRENASRFREAWLRRLPLDLAAAKEEEAKALKAWQDAHARVVKIEKNLAYWQQTE